MLPRALNHMAVPDVRWDALLRLARAIGCVGVEFRNDLGRPLFEGDDPVAVKAEAERLNIRVLALAELKAFNDWSDAKREEAASLMRIAKACGAETVSLIARNDNRGMGNGERQANLRLALRELLPLLKEHGLIGLIEPLGFETCALRDKGEAVEAIEALGARDHCRIVHDTFHHTIAGGGAIYPEHTGIVHISGVVDPSLAVSEMRDEHRVLVDRHDRLGNVEQIQRLAAAGYAGPVSFEPFAAEVHGLADPKSALAKSFSYIAEELEAMAA